MAIRILLYIGLFFAILFIRIKFIEAKAVFYPTKEIVFTPPSMNLSFEDIFVKTPDNIKINGWYIAHQGAKYTLLFCHGNAGNIGDRLDKISFFHSLGLNVFIIDYRGYGASLGHPTEAGIYLDVKTAYNYLVTQRATAPQKIILYGESLGGAVAIDLASKVKASALIIEGTFSNGRDMAKKLYPYLPALFFSNKFDSLSKIKNVNIPKLFIHSQGDEIVPLDLAKKLYDASFSPKQFIEIRGGHNTSFSDCQEEIAATLISFIEKLKEN